MAPPDWLKRHGWLLPHASEGKPTHLLLDGGKARVPDESAGAFLNAYAIAVVQGSRPSVVELRTPVFKLFLDLDIKVPAGAALDTDVMVSILQARVPQFFCVEEPRAIVCTTDPQDREEHTKQGRHVVWTNVFVTPPLALAFRDAVVADLEEQLPGACAVPWASVVDACVFRANGLRMPFSEKGRGGTSVYTPVEVWSGAEREPITVAAGVSAMRKWVHELSIRTFFVDETPVREGIAVEAEAPGERLAGTSKSLKEYEAVLPLLDAVLPVQFAGQRFTGILKAESCYLLRSSSLYCLNKGGRHSTCGIYWILSLKGVRQACYCRCDTTDGRKYGLCRDFKSDIWPVPDEVLTAFFGERSAATTFKPSKLPSAKAVGIDVEQLFANSRPPLVAPRSKKPRKKKHA